MSTIQMIAVPIASARGGQMVFSRNVTPVMIANSSQPAVIHQQMQGQRPTRVIATPYGAGAQKATPYGAGAQKRSLGPDVAEYFESKKRRGDKGGKGLRHFSTKVCEKVQQKGTTTYNEVADELVAEFTDPNNYDAEQMLAGYDQKNIRRRVYDALNVLMAMNIISKEKKEIRWIGLPTNSAQECLSLDLEKQRRVDQVNSKLQVLHELILQQIAFKNLVQRNRQLEEERGAPAANSTVRLPFVLLKTSKKTVVDCSISNDKSEYQFNLNNKFEIHEDTEVLRRLGLMSNLDTARCTPADLKKAIKLVPSALESYVFQLANGIRSIDALGFDKAAPMSRLTSLTRHAGGAGTSKQSDCGDIEVCHVFSGRSSYSASPACQSPDVDSDDYSENNSEDDDDDDDDDDE